MTEYATRPVVRLTDYEYLWCVRAGSDRILGSVGLNAAKVTASRTVHTRLYQELVGVAGELGWAKFTGQYRIPPLHEFHRISDAPGDIEIRATAIECGHLILYDNDDPGRKFVLAICYPPTATVVFVGWIYGREGMVDKYTHEGNKHPDWWVPQSDLRDMATIDEAL